MKLKDTIGSMASRFAVIVLALTCAGGAWATTVATEAALPAKFSYNDFVEALYTNNGTFDGSATAYVDYEKDEAGRLIVAVEPLGGDWSAANCTAAWATPYRINDSAAQLQLYHSVVDARKGKDTTAAVDVSVKNVAFQVAAPASSTITGGFAATADLATAKAYQLYLMNDGDVAFENCEFDGLGLAVFPPEAYLQGNVAGGYTARDNATIVKGCSFKNIYDYAIKEVNTPNYYVTGTTFENCGIAMLIHPLTGGDAGTAAFVGNTFKNIDTGSPWNEKAMGGSGTVKFDVRNSGTEIIWGANTVAGCSGVADTAYYFRNVIGNVVTELKTDSTDEHTISYLSSGVEFATVTPGTIDVSESGIVTWSASKTYVAQIGANKYETLAEAIAAVPTTGAETTITMIANEAIDIVGNALVIAASKNVVLDLNGFQVVGSCSTGENSALILNNGTLTIVDSSDLNADGTGTGKLASSASPAWRWSGVDGDYSSSYASNLISNNGTVSVESGLLEVINPAGTIVSASYAIDSAPGGVVNIKGGKLTSACCTVIRVRVDNSTQSALNISGGSVVAVSPADRAIWLQDSNYNGNSTVNISGGLVSGPQISIMNDSSGSNAKATITGGTFDGFFFTYSELDISDGTFNGGKRNSTVFSVSAYGSKSHISGGVFYGFADFYSRASTLDWSVTGGAFSYGGPYQYASYTSEAFVRGGIYDDEQRYIAPGFVLTGNTDPATKDAYPYAVVPAVASITSDDETTYYADLQTAIADAATGDTVTLLTDVTLTGQSVSGESALYGAFITKSITLDGDNHTIVGSNCRAIGVKGVDANNMVEVSFKNLTVTDASSNAICICTRGNIEAITLDNVTLDTTGCPSGYNQPLTIGGTQSSAAKVDIKNGSVIKTNDQASKYYAIIVWNPVEMTIDDSTIMGWACVYMKSGSEGSTVAITDSKLVSTGLSGNSNSFAALVTEAGNVSIDVTGTEIDVTAAAGTYQGIGLPCNQSDVAITLGTGNTVTLTGDTAIIGFNMNIGDVTVSGGTFNKEVEFYYCADGYVPSKQDPETGLYTVDEGTFVALLVRDNVVVNMFTSLAEAIAAVPTDGTETTIQMIADSAEAAETAMTIASTQNVVIDLAGHTVSGTFAESKTAERDFIKNHGTLTVKDSSAVGTGKITMTTADSDNSYGSQNVTIYNEGGTFTLEGGCIENLSGYCAYAIVNSSNSWDQYIVSTFNMTGGSVSCPHGDQALRVYQNCAATQNENYTCQNYVNISGGTIVDTGIWLDGFLYTTGWDLTSYTGENIKTVVDISGGTINGLFDYSVRHPYNTEVKISGGTFTECRIRVRTDYTNGLEDDASPAFAISGGKFAFAANGGLTLGSGTAHHNVPYLLTGGYYTSEPAAEYVASGYGVYDGITGYPYTVLPEHPVVVADQTTIAETTLALTGAVEGATEFRLDEVSSDGKDRTKGTAQTESSFSVNLETEMSDATVKYYQIVAIKETTSSTEEDTSSAVIGVMKIENAGKNVIIPIPWASLSSGGEISVANLVRTATLTEGDTIEAYDAGTYKAWTLGSDGQWEASSVTSTSGTDKGTDADKFTIPRGAAVWLTRSDATKPIYLVGAAASGSASITLEAGDASEPSWNLVGNPTAAAVSVANVAKSTDDKIVVPTATVPKTYFYNEKKQSWGYWDTVADGGLVKSVWKTDDASIPAGTGFWYLNGGEAKNLWTGVEDGFDLEDLPVTEDVGGNL